MTRKLPTLARGIAIVCFAIGTACSPAAGQSTPLASAPSEAAPSSTPVATSAAETEITETPNVNISDETAQEVVATETDGTEPDTDKSTDDVPAPTTTGPKIRFPTTPGSLPIFGHRGQNSNDEDSANDDDVTSVATEEPDDGDRFLGTDDTFALDLGEDAGYGERWMPGIVEGEPLWTGTHVVSLGAGGTIDIELGGFIAVDGPGADFIVFENVLYGWQEPAQVSVSSDGVHYYKFSCAPDDIDGNHPGCAGVNEINYTDDLAALADPATSGGDAFDLVDVGLTEARFIRITDMSETETTVGEGVGKSGFDLDAVAIVNGINE